MDKRHTPPEAPGLPVNGPHCVMSPESDVPPGFVPLRLVLQPSGAVIEVTKPQTLVGRHTEADVRLPLPDVSRRHCRFVWVEGCWQVIDLNSLNGVQVNGESIMQAPLHEGDRIKIGGFTFAVELTSQSDHVPLRSTTGGIVQSIARTLTGFRKAS